MRTWKLVDTDKCGYTLESDDGYTLGVHHDDVSWSGTLFEWISEDGLVDVTLAATEFGARPPCEPECWADGIIRCAVDASAFDATQ